MTAHVPIASPPVMQRARGAVEISAVRAPGDITRLERLRQQGSFRAIFPRPIQGNIEAVLINTAGGVTGGDAFCTKVTARAHAQISITTQAAERIYRASDSKSGLVKTSLRVDARARLNWLPQETILFEGARLDRRLDVDLHPDATFLMVEPLVFGREASGETLRSGRLNDIVSIVSNGRLIYHDHVRLTGDIDALLRRSAVANRAGAAASLVYVDPAAKTLLAPIRALLGAAAGASLLADGVLVLRILSSDSHTLRSTLLPILDTLTHAAVPKNWRL